MAFDGLNQIIATVFAVSATVAFVILAGSTVAYLFNAHKLFEYLKIYYPKAWKALGEPHLFWNNTIQNSGAFAAVLKSDVSEGMTDHDVAHMLRKTKRLYSASSNSLILCLACFIGYSIFRNL